MANSTASAQIRSLLRSDRRKALTHLFESHFEMMTLAANRIVQDPPVAEDLVQEIFLKLIENSAPLERADSIPGYLRRSAVNRAIDHYRKESKRRQVDVGKVFDLHTGERTDQAITTAETAQAIKAAIDELPQQCKVVFLLKRKEGYSNKEVADFLGISVKTVENQVTKAMKRLRASLGHLAVWCLILAELLR